MTTPQTRADGVDSSQGRPCGRFSPEAAPGRGDAGWRPCWVCGGERSGVGDQKGLGDRRPCTLLVQLGEHSPPPPSGCKSS